MAIQQGINQLLSLAGTAAMLSPQLRAKAETRAATQAAERKAATLNKAMEITEAKQSTLMEDLLSRTKEVEEEIAAGNRDYGKEQGEYYASEAAIKNFETQAATTAKQAEIAEQLFELDPTSANYESLVRHKSTAEYKAKMPELLRSMQDYRMSSREEAMRKMQQKGTDQVKQKHMFQSLVDSLSEAERSGYNG